MFGSSLEYKREYMPNMGRTPHTMNNETELGGYSPLAIDTRYLWCMRHTELTFFLLKMKEECENFLAGVLSYCLSTSTTSCPAAWKAFSRATHIPTPSVDPSRCPPRMQTCSTSSTMQPLSPDDSVASSSRAWSARQRSSSPAYPAASSAPSS